MTRFAGPPPSPHFSLEQLTAVLAALPDPAFVLTKTGRYAAIFGGADARYYHDGSVLEGRSIADVLTEQKTRWFLDQIDLALRTRQLQVVEYGLASGDVKGLEAGGLESTLWFEGRVQALDFPVADEAAVLWVASNITQRHEMELQLKELSETDELTRLANRRQLMHSLESAWQAFRRHASPTSLLVLDIDRFKQINDELGHACGDEALRAVAAVCRQELRVNDLAARLGGDEFVLLMPHTSPPGAALIAERLRARLGLALAAFTTSATSATAATVSIGLSEFLVTDDLATDALGRADRALYAAKRAGKDQVQTAS